MLANATSPTGLQLARLSITAADCPTQPRLPRLRAGHTSAVPHSATQRHQGLLPSHTLRRKVMHRAWQPCELSAAKARAQPACTGSWILPASACGPTACATGVPLLLPCQIADWCCVSGWAMLLEGSSCNECACLLHVDPHLLQMLWNLLIHCFRPEAAGAWRRTCLLADA